MLININLNQRKVFSAENFEALLAEKHALQYILPTYKFRFLLGGGKLIVWRTR